MKTKTLEMLFALLVALVFVVLIALILVNETEQNKEFGGFKEITGTMQNFEVSHDSYQNYAPTKTSDRYDEKYLGYLDSIEKSRDNTFLR
ncbi:hypothetical protein HYU50_04605 [Candidatus Woesearchaeota archaeon]|nr:hypothetical protein [Candidatus Woesearchaeota archaeon]